MRKLLFIAPVEWNDDCSGVTQKVRNEYKCFEDFFDVYVAAFRNNDVIVINKGQCVLCDDNHSIHRVARLYSLENLVKVQRIEIVYIRYSMAFPKALFFLQSIRKCVSKIVIEYPDYPYIPQWRRLKRYKHIVCDICLRRIMSRYVDHVFACSRTEFINGVEASQLINGTDISLYKIKTVKEKEYIGIISVSTMSPMHGIDRFLLGLDNYYKNGGIIDIKVFLIGDGQECNNLQNLVIEKGLQNHVLFVGLIPNSEQEKYYAMSEIGLGALGFHRVNIKDDSTLKTREYGLRGLPIIAENKLDVVDDGYPYVMYLSWDDTPIDINVFLDKYRDWYNQETKIEVAQKIRKYFIAKCDIKNTMKDIVEYLNN